MDGGFSERPSRPPPPPAHIHPARLANIPAPVDVKPKLSASSTTPASSDRAARLAQMAADADSHTSSRLATLEQRRIQEEQRERDEAREREKYGKQDTKGAYVREQEKMMMGGGAIGLGDVLGRRGGKGLLREDL